VPGCPGWPILCEFEEKHQYLVLQPKSGNHPSCSYAIVVLALRMEWEQLAPLSTTSSFSLGPVLGQIVHPTLSNKTLLDYRGRVPV